jgi:ketose-bisphosphate aldolase
MLSTNLRALQDARKNGYAIPAINTQGGNYDIIRAICLAAEEMRSPVILAHYVSTGAYSGHDWFVAVAKWMADKVSVPVSIHLDHGDGFPICMEALRLGFTSLMLDASALPVVENAAAVNEVMKTAHAFGVPVEAEVGELVRLDGEGRAESGSCAADPEDVRRFLDVCRPDTLAVGIGNAHGFYKGTPDIRLDILEKVRGFTDVPLVLHGCTGMSEDVVRRAIGLGVAKINYGTQIRYNYVNYLKEALDTMDHKGHSFKTSQFASDRLKEDVKAIILASGSNGRA